MYKLSRGDLVIVAPGKYHDIRFDGNREYERINILFDPEAMGLECATRVASHTEVVSLSDRPETAAIFAKMARYQEALSEQEFVKAASHLLYELFCDLSLDEQEKRRYSKLHPMLSEALSYISDNLFAIRNVQTIAEALHVTEGYLFRLFREELNTSPKKYVTDKRLLAAQGMIRLGRRPSEVYAECGFSDYTSFFRSYKKFFGVSPSKG
jgi:AraC-like DNA-binding protein